MSVSLCVCLWVCGCVCVCVSVCRTHSAWVLALSGKRRSSALGGGESLSPASRGSAALEELFSSEEEAELWERWGTWRLRCCWPRLSGTSGGRQGECVSRFSPTTLPEETRETQKLSDGEVKPK